jgi:hypothetical protein
LAQLLDFGFFLLSGRCGLFHSFILPAFATEVFFDLNPYRRCFVQLGNKTISSVVLKRHYRVLMPETAVPFQYIHKTYAETGLVYDNSWF